MSALRLCGALTCAASLAATPACDAQREDAYAHHVANASADAHASHSMHAAAPEPSPGYTMRVEPTGAIAPHELATLDIELTDSAGRPVRDLAVVHEKELHFLIMSRDLVFFSHEHPVSQGDGRLTLPFTFPEAGEYVLFGDYTPEGASQVISSARLTVPGASAMTEPALALDDLSRAKRFGAYDVHLDQKAEGAGTLLTFRITKQGIPVRDLQPFLGALGHLVLVDPDATTLLHSHPLGAGKQGEVAFHTTLPPGRAFKLWAEFRPDGDPLRADFVIASTARGDGAGAALHLH